METIRSNYFLWIIMAENKVGRNASTIKKRFDQLEKYTLNHTTTPLIKLNYSVNGFNIYMKRDDLTDFYFGGNKVRLFEYIVPDILRASPQKIVTVGTADSNHVRVAAAVAERINLECDLIIVGDVEKNKRIANEGNMLLASMCRANLIYCHSFAALLFIKQYLEEQEAQGTSCIFIPGGGHVTSAVFGYVDAMKEIMDQSREVGVEFDSIYLPTGSGTTQAGLLLGKQLYSYYGAIYGLSVDSPVTKCKREINELLCSAYDLYEGIKTVPESDVLLLENSTKYGEIDENAVWITNELIKSDGICLDPIYNAKSFWKMVCELKTQSNGGNVLYINTGGLPGIFTSGARKAYANLGKNIKNQTY